MFLVNSRVILVPKAKLICDIPVERFDGKFWEANLTLVWLFPFEIDDEWTDDDPILTFCKFRSNFLKVSRSLSSRAIMSSNSFSDSFWSSKAKTLSSIALILTNLSVSRLLTILKQLLILPFQVQNFVIYLIFHVPHYSHALCRHDGFSYAYPVLLQPYL